MAAKESVHFKARLTATAVADYIGELARGLRSGSLVLADGTQSLGLRTSAHLDFRLSVESTHGGAGGAIDLRLKSRIEEASAPRSLVIRSNEDVPGAPAAADTPIYRGFNLRTKSECIILDPEIVVLKNGRLAAKGLASDDHRTTVVRILRLDEARSEQPTERHSA